MPRLSHTQMRRLTALVRLEGAERIPLDNNVQDKLVKENYATRNGNGNLTLTEDGQNEIERLSTIMGLIKKPSN